MSAFLEHRLFPFNVGEGSPDKVGPGTDYPLGPLTLEQMTWLYYNVRAWRCTGTLTADLQAPSDNAGPKTIEWNGELDRGRPTREWLVVDPEKEATVSGGPVVEFGRLYLFWMPVEVYEPADWPDPPYFSDINGGEVNIYYRLRTFSAVKWRPFAGWNPTALNVEGEWWVATEFLAYMGESFWVSMVIFGDGNDLMPVGVLAPDVGVALYLPAVPHPVPGNRVPSSFSLTLEAVPW